MKRKTLNLYYHQWSEKSKVSHQISINYKLWKISEKDTRFPKLKNERFFPNYLKSKNCQITKSIVFNIILIKAVERPCDIMVKALDCNLKVKGFKL